jgi:LysM repeat protein
MPFETPLAAEGNPESLRHVESFHASGDRVGHDIQAQLSQPNDIASANQFFKPTGGEHFLPPGNVGANHIEMGAMNPSGHFAAPPMTGLETHGLTALPPGGDIAGLAGAGAMPGAEPISPLINMIMKMPGHIGLASSFFEALGAFFAPAMEAMGHVAGGLDIAGLFEHAGAAADAVTHGLEHGLDAAGDHLAVEPNLLPGDAPIFDQLGSSTGNGLASGAVDGGQSLQFHGNDLNFNPDHHLRDTFAQSPRLEVGGGPSSPIFEMSHNGGGLGFEGANNNYLAMEPNNGLGGTVGNFTSPAAQPIPPPTAVHPPLSTQMPHNSLSSHNPFSSFNNSNLNHSQGDFGRDVADNGHSNSGAPEHHFDANSHPEQNQPGHEAGTAGGDNVVDRVQEINQVGEAPTTNYTVHNGDNLWDIARNQLGDGSRWEEIYHLNQNVLGENPRLIMPGTELQLPGGEAAANGIASDYTVQSGDNLWDISKDHLAGGEHWHELYQGNEGVIGANPDMIHPGQHLHMDGGAQTHTLADAQSHSPAHSQNHSQSHSQNHSLNHSLAHSPTHTASHSVAHVPAHAAAHPEAAASSGELKAQAQTLSNIQSYTDSTSQAVDSSTSVPNTH